MSKVRPGTVLSMLEHREIQDAAKNGESDEVQAVRYNVSPQSIERIRRRLTNKAVQASRIDLNPPITISMTIVDRALRHVKANENTTIPRVAKALSVTKAQALTALSTLVQQQRIIRTATDGDAEYKSTNKSLSDVRDTLKLMDMARASC